MKNDLCLLNANEAIARFKLKEISPVELLNAVIKQYESIGSKLNAFTYTYFDEALKKAREEKKKYWIT